MPECNIEVEVTTADNYEVCLLDDSVISLVSSGSGIGTGAGASFITNEIPNGSINGLNSSFTTSYLFKSNNIWIFLNGLRLLEAYYTITSTNSFTLDDPPLPGDTISVDYILF